MRVDVAIIGGTGVGDRLLQLGGESLHVPTEFGVMRAKRLVVNGVSIALVGRHSAGHKTPPHKVNYRAISTGVRSLEVKGCFSSAAVGSLVPDWGPGTMIACSDFLDFSGRNLTLFDSKVIHTDFSQPFAESARRSLIDAAAASGIAIQEHGVYVCGNGPRYETPAEIRLYRQFGGDVVGMTAATEAILMREAGVAYATLAVVTNLAAGISSEPLSHVEVVEEMQRSGAKAVQILLDAASRQAGLA